MAKTPRKGDNSRNTGLEAFVTFPGVEMVEGTLVSHDKTGVKFAYNRYSSRYEEFIPATRIVSCIGSVGGDATVWYRTDAKTLFNTGKRDRPIPISEPAQYGDHLIMGSSPEHGVILLDPQLTRIVGKQTEGNRGRKAGGGEDKKTKSSSKSKSGGKSGGDKKVRNGKDKSGDDWD